MAQSSSPRPWQGLQVRSPKISPGISGILERRGIKLPSIITDFHNEMPKRQVWPHDSDDMSTAGFLKAKLQEVSKWSSDSPERNTGEGTGNSADANKSASSNEPESPFDVSESIEQRLERWQKFYTEKSMESFMEKDDYEEYLDEVLFDRLYQELQYTVYETRSLKHRGQEQVRLFWDDVRSQLRDDEESVALWDPAEEVQHCTAWKYEDNPSSDLIPEQRPISRPVAGQDDFRITTTRSKSPPSTAEPPTVRRTVTVEDAELQEIREWLMNRKRMREERARQGR